ncbi:hypothetical protein D9611_002912 [Ephemerocybe angulata]|uniref:Uncharacterized protein n=1 Tax=Ephemerocybe angulata TaxID=980116 RepID=A0A8H5C7W2_9AGAR|nr:hypothetical protein D9611_002912 [Tulosesus angulatus]
MMFKQLLKPGMAIAASSPASRTIASIVPRPIAITKHCYSAKASPKHNSDTYAKDDVDPSPPSDSSVFKVDSGSECVQKPTEKTLSGEWSKAGARTNEYASSDPAYNTKAGKQPRYGGLEGEAPKPSETNEGPEAKGSHGRQ